MRIPLSWLKDYVDIDVLPEVLAERLTTAGFEADKITYIGVPQNQVEGIRMPKSNHLVWDRERLLLGAIREVKPHPLLRIFQRACANFRQVFRLRHNVPFASTN